MYKQIKDLADEAIALQNKDRMDVALREISGMCADTAEVIYATTVPNLATGERVAAPNPVALGEPVGEIVAPCPEVDAGLAEACAVNRAMVEEVAAKTGGDVVVYGEAEAGPIKSAKQAPAVKAKKGGAK